MKISAMLMNENLVLYADGTEFAVLPQSVVESLYKLLRDHYSRCPCAAGWSWSNMDGRWKSAL